MIIHAVPAMYVETKIYVAIMIVTIYIFEIFEK